MKRIVVFYNGERGKAVMTALEETDNEVIESFTPATFPTPARLRKLRPNLSVVAGFPIIFTKEMIDIPKYGTINCHAGPLPSYRGGSPLNWQIMNGAERLWVSVIQMDEGLDTGPILSQTSFPLGDSETIADAHEKANIAFAEAVVSVVWLFENDVGQSNYVMPQNRYIEPQAPHYGTDQSCYEDCQTPKTWPQRDDDMGEISPQTMTASEIHNKVRALTHPYPGAWIKAKDGKRVRIWKTTKE